LAVIVEHRLTKALEWRHRTLSFLADVRNVASDRGRIDAWGVVLDTSTS
jgi:hypothetical protein